MFVCNPAISYVTFVHSGLSAIPLLPTVVKSWERFRLQILKLPLEQQMALYDWLAEAIASQQLEAAELLEIPLGAGRVCILVTDILHKQHHQYIILVLACIHPTAQFITACQREL